MPVTYRTLANGTTLISYRDLAPGTLVVGTEGRDKIAGDGSLGITIVGLGGSDFINPGIPHFPLQGSYTAIYEDYFANGSPFPDQYEWGGRRFNFGTIAWGQGYEAKGGPGPDIYELHGRADFGPLIAKAPQIDWREDTLIFDRTDERKWADGLSFSNWQGVQLDADTVRVRGFDVQAHSDNPVVDHQWARIGLLPSGNGDARSHHYLDLDFTGPNWTDEAARWGHEQARINEGMFA